MNEIVNKFTLVEDKFITKCILDSLDLHFKVCGPFTKKKKRIKKIKDRGE